MIRVQGKPIEVINLAIQITGSVIADMPKLMQPYIIGCVQKSIPLAVENDAVAERRNSEDEEWQKPEPAETKKPEPEKNEEKHTAHTAGFFMAKEVAKADPEFRRFLRDILADLDKEVRKSEQCRHTFRITVAKCAPCDGYNLNCEHYEKTNKGAADTKHLSR